MPPTEDLPEQMRVRREKAEGVRARGAEPWPLGFPRTAMVEQVRADHAGIEPDQATGVRVAVAGRVLLNRIGGKLCFATLRDGSGEIQLMLSLDRLG